MTLSDGRLLLNVTADVIDESAQAASCLDCTPSILLGLVDGSETENDPPDLFAALPAVSSALVRFLLVFDGSAGNTHPHILPISSPQDSKTKICEIASSYLLRLHEYSQALSASVREKHRLLSIPEFTSVSKASPEFPDDQLHAQLCTIEGSLYLLAGRLPDAYSSLSQAAKELQNIALPLWQARALEHLLLCVLMSNVTFKVYAGHTPTCC